MEELSFVKIFQSSSKFSGVTLFNKLINIPKSIIVAMILGPKEFGIIGAALLVTTYAQLINFGTVSVAFREIPGLLNQKREDKIIFLQNNAITIDFLLNIVLFCCIISYSISFYTYNSFQFSLLLIFAAIQFLVNKILSYYETVNIARKYFDLTAKIRFYISLINAILTITLIYWLKIYTLIVIPLIASVIGIILLRKQSALKYRFVFEWSEVKRLLKIGISISAGGFLYNIFIGTIDQTVIVTFLTSEELGLFIFALGYVNLLIELLRDIGRVMSPIVWGKADIASSDLSAFEDTKRIGVYISLIASLLITFSQLGFILLVNIFTIKFVDSQILFFILTSQIFLESIGIIPAIILGSNRANSQNKILSATGMGVFLNIILDIIVVKLGYGLIGVGIVTVLTQGLATLLLYFYSQKYLSDNYTRLLDYLKSLVLPYVIAIIFTLFHIMIYSALSLWFVVCLSLTAQLIVWMLFFKYIYPDYINVARIFFISKEYLLKLFNKAV